MLVVKMSNKSNKDLIKEQERNDLKKLAEEVARGELKHEKEKELSITFMDNEEIAELNQKYRSSSGPTDVLAFPMEGKLLGEVIVSLEMALEQAEDYQHSFMRELGFLVVHGVLHLCGYNHKSEQSSREMKTLEEKYLQKFDRFRS